MINYRLLKDPFFEKGKRDYEFLYDCFLKLALEKSRSNVVNQSDSHLVVSVCDWKVEILVNFILFVVRGLNTLGFYEERPNSYPTKDLA